MFREHFSVRLIFAVLLVFLIAGNSSTQAQGDTELPVDSKAKAGADLRFAVVWNSRNGSFTFVPEKWGELHLSIENLKNEPRDLLCATYFGDQSNLQYGRRLWVPPHSRLRINHPVLIPKHEETKGESIKMHSLVLEGSSSDEALIRSETGQLLHDGAMLVSRAPRNTGLIAGTSAKEDLPAEIQELISACRVSQRLSNKVVQLDDPFLSPDEFELNYLDHLVIAENRLVNDFAALSAVRRWMFSGGSLWIMLDRVDPVILERLLGDDYNGQVIDRVGLTTVQIDRTPTLMEPAGAIGKAVEYEKPVEMTRMTVTEMDIPFTVDGWPAAATRKFGDGRLLVTTLGPRAWMSLREAYRKRGDESPVTYELVPGAEMKLLASDAFNVRQPELLTQAVVEPFAREFIGYTVPSAMLIIGTLFGFLLTLLATGLLLQRFERLEYLGLFGSILAFAASGLLIYIGITYRHSIPGTIASVQFAKAVAGTDDFQTQGAVAVYQPEGSQKPIQTTGGGLLWPDMTGVESSNRRMVTTDLGAYHWENLAQSSGLRVSPFTKGQSLSKRIEARASFDSKGLVGKFTGQASGTDALIATGNGRMGATLQSDGTFSAVAEDVFEGDQYLSASFLGDEELRRKRLLEKVLNNLNRKDYPDRPQLMVWSDRWENGFDFGDGLARRGSTLIAVPLVIDRPPNGTEILIPSPFFNCRNQVNPDGTPSSPMWNEQRKEWPERSSPGTSWLNFQIPRELLPLSVKKARLEIKVTGPIGRIELLGLKFGQITSLKSVTDPVGASVFEIDDPSFLTISNDGALVLGLSAGDPSRPELTNTKAGPPGAAKEGAAPAAKLDPNAKVNYWQILSLGLQLWATTAEPTMKD